MKHDLIISNGGAVIDPNSGIFQPLAGSAILRVEPNQLRNGNAPFNPELQYLGLLQELIDKADEDLTPREDRTGTGTYSVFGRQIRFDLEQGFPLLTTKKVAWKAVVAELAWILSGSTNIKDLDAKIWDEWADERGELGPVYGKQWRAWDGKPEQVTIEGFQATNLVTTPIDQIAQLIQNLKDRPNDRGHVISAWNVSDLPDMALRPCHCLFQFYVDGGKLSCQLYQRSADIFLGVPFNIASYALLTHLIAGAVGLKVGEFIHTFGDLHLYSNHVEQARLQVSRDPRVAPLVLVEDGTDPLNFKPDQVELIDYNPHPAIKGDVSV